MVAHQTKSFKGNHKPLFLVALGVIGMGIFLALYVSGMFSFAAPRIGGELKNLEPSNGLKLIDNEKFIDKENDPQKESAAVLEPFLPNSSIRNSDKVTVDGVVNVAQYLTSLVLESPSSSRDPITLNYNAELNALRIDGNINADALTIGASNTSSQGNATIGGTENKVLFSQNGLVVGGKRNQIQANAHNAVVVGSEGVNVTSNNSDILAIGAVSSNFRGGNQVVGAIGGEVDSQRAKNSVALGQGKKKLSGPTSILMGGAIDSSRADHVFVWSDKNETFNPQQSNAFYVNSVNGLGLNTRKPTTQLDIGEAGALKVALNRVNSCSAESKGIVSYTLGADNQLKSFCGCDGKRWVPLAGDMSPKAVAACAKQNQMTCTGTVQNADKGASSTYPLRNPDANGGEGDWEALGWKYEKENTPLEACKFNCKVGFHPDADDPEGWLPPKSCIACTTFANRYDAGVNSGWKTAGTGDNNCDFGCKASFKYQNEGKNKRSCSDCEIGTYTLDNNQDKSCKNCKSPARLWRDTNPKPAINLTDSYFHFTTKGTGKNACNFECAPRYRYFYNGAGSSKNGYIGKYTRVDGNACIYCKIGTWSVGGQTPGCTKCSNAPAKIDYWVNGTKSVLENFTTYTTNGANNDCGRKCKSELGLQESGKSCICQNGKHLEGGKCEPNQKAVNCDKTGLPSGEGVSITENEKVTIKWEGKWNNGSWSSPKKCEWKCESGYIQVGNSCVKPIDGKCKEDVVYGCNQGTATEKSSIVGGNTWFCAGNNGGKKSNKCVKCNEGYKRNGDSCEKVSTVKAEWVCNAVCKPIDKEWCERWKEESKSICRTPHPVGGKFIYRMNDWGHFESQPGGGRTIVGGAYPRGKCTYCGIEAYGYKGCENNLPNNQAQDEQCQWYYNRLVSNHCRGTSIEECEGSTEQEQREKWDCSLEEVDSDYPLLCKRGDEIVDGAECDKKEYNAVYDSCYTRLVAGKCNNQTVSDENGKATGGRCEQGTPINFKETTNGWTWDCEGSEEYSTAKGCKATCDATKGLVFDNKTKTCKKPLQAISGKCQNSIVITDSNTTPAPGTCLAGSVKAGSFKTNTNGWERICEGVNGGSNSPKCNASCKDPLKFVNNGGIGACIQPKPKCTGLDFKNATLIPGDDKNLETDVPKTLVVNDTSKKCEWKCNAGYTLQNGSCVKLGGKCTGLDFKNATLIPGDDKNLETDVKKTLVVNDTSKKCEWKCNAGYTLQNGICGKKPSNYCRKDEVSNGRFPAERCISEKSYEFRCLPSKDNNTYNQFLHCIELTDPLTCEGVNLVGEPMGRPTGCTWIGGGAPRGGKGQSSGGDGGASSSQGGNGRGNPAGTNHCSYQKDEASCKKLYSQYGCKWVDKYIPRKVCVDKDTDRRVNDSYCKGAGRCNRRN